MRATNTLHVMLLNFKHIYLFQNEFYLIYMRELMSSLLSYIDGILSCADYFYCYK